MREIKFRGKSIVTGEWCFGDLFQHGDQKFIMANNRNTEVDPETVGQYTGLTDKNGVKIFEGDIIKGKSKVVYVVEYSQNIAKYISRGFGVLSCPCMNTGSMKYYEVIGNIYDNPELVGA